MGYELWLQLYLAQLIEKIQTHPFGLNYDEEYVEELCYELLEKCGFGEDDGNWEDKTVTNAVEESFQLWINDYFCYDNDEKVYSPYLFPNCKNDEITLLDYFAAKSMSNFVNTGLNFENVAKASYSLAKCMLVERQKVLKDKRDIDES